jgi:hypothetical protein
LVEGAHFGPEQFIIVSHSGEVWLVKF